MNEYEAQTENISYVLLYLTKTTKATETIVSIKKIKGYINNNFQHSHKERLKAFPNGYFEYHQFLSKV